MNNLNVKYDQSKQVLVVKSIGSVCTTDFIHAIQKLPTYLNGHPGLNVLLDLSDTDIRVAINELRYISDYLLKVVLHKCIIRIAKIVNRPYETALAFLFKDLIQNRSHYEIEVFSTKSAAIRWLINYNR